jgi:hypothetical protein
LYGNVVKGIRTFYKHMDDIYIYIHIYSHVVDRNFGVNTCINKRQQIVNNLMSQLRINLIV